MQRIEPVMNIQINNTTLTNLKVRGGEARYGPISPIFLVTSVRSMATMNENAERSKHIITMAGPMSLKKNKAHQRLCSSCIKQLKNIAAHIYGYYIVVATIT